jgi:hypothetical protein
MVELWAASMGVSWAARSVAHLVASRVDMTVVLWADERGMQMVEQRVACLVERKVGSMAKTKAAL